MIPTKERGMYQAVQNILHGFGAICGASLGGLICDAIGWRFCFLLQVPVSIVALIIAKIAVPKNPKKHDAAHEHAEPTRRSTWEQVDLSGAFLLIVGLSLQLAAMSMGGNGLSWSSPVLLGCLISSILLLAGFFVVESRTKAIPLMPLTLLKSVDRGALLLINVCLGMTGYGVS
jgi:MFS family permease